MISTGRASLNSLAITVICLQSYYHSDILTFIITNVKLKCIENVVQTEPIFIMDQNIKSWHTDKKHYNLGTGLYLFVDEVVIGCNSNQESLLVSCLMVFYFQI